MRGNLAALARLVIGAWALAINLDLLEIDLVRRLKTWWLRALIALGVGLLFTLDEAGKRS